ncbi:hypothetical protein GCM10020358_01520 [Amorphoplanes nipponensis]|uniref:CBM2 domain-containing protein n=1 Tax=Actinoplanes nipponensis TaxID=135950 RepID=A0A919JD54_9ACTN|nr:cellulose binding domain-containing protein [Actinoplanes nipponensis]GIE48221.1 hypothetical protein Ani05nite_17550 [Actinoplanes nipponensis]
MRRNPPPEPRRGVLGYAAELQQFDPVPAYVYDLAAPEPAPAPWTAPTAPGSTRSLTPTAAAPAVSHIRQRPRRPGRAMMIAGAAVVILAGAGLGYAGLGHPSGGARAQAPRLAVSALPTEDAPVLDPGLLGAEPVAGRTTGPAPTSTGAAGSGTGRPARSRPGSGKSPSRPGPPVPPVAQPGDRATPPAPGPATTEPVVAPAPPLPLTAVLRHAEEAAADGFLGYAATIRLENPGSREVTAWRVTLTVPGGNPVTASGASVGQDGETVTFTPLPGATVPAGGAVTFSFEVAGLLAALPGGCTVDGAPCS